MEPEKQTRTLSVPWVSALDLRTLCGRRGLCSGISLGRRRALASVCAGALASLLVVDVLWVSALGLCFGWSPCSGGQRVSAEIQDMYTTFTSKYISWSQQELAATHGTASRTLELLVQYLRRNSGAGYASENPVYSASRKVEGLLEPRACRCVS